MERTASTAPQEQPDLAALPELMGQTASMVRTELLVRPAQQEQPEPLVQLRQSWTETWATATRPKVIVHSSAQLAAATRLWVFKRSIATPTAPTTRPWVIKRFTATQPAATKA